jgi:hypothetical protein
MPSIVSEGKSVRTKLLVTGMIVALTAAALSPPAAAAKPTAARHKHGMPLLLTFDANRSLQRGTLVRDASGHGHPGRVRSADGGRIAMGDGWVRRGAIYQPGRGRAIIEVKDSPALDPRRRSFVFGAAVRLTKAQGARGSNLIQKGYFHQAGGQYKLQIDRGVPSCVVAGGLGRVKVSAQRSIANDRWHRMSCTRTPTKVTLWIDGKARASVAERTGWLANTSPLRIGGKNLDPSNDQYRGRIDSVYLRWLP